MLHKIFLIYGVLICLGFGYASLIGWSVMDFNSFGRIVPIGPRVHHK